MFIPRLAIILSQSKKKYAESVLISKPAAFKVKTLSHVGFELTRDPGISRLCNGLD